MDKASAHGAGDCRFESYRGQSDICRVAASLRCPHQLECPILRQRAARMHIDTLSIVPAAAAFGPGAATQGLVELAAARKAVAAGPTSRRPVKFPERSA